MEYYSIGEFSKKVGKSISTLRDWEAKGRLIPHHRTKGNQRMYAEEQVYEVLQRPNINVSRITIGYCRVSTKKQKDDLQRQIDMVRMYMVAKGYTFEIITDIGSGIYYEKEGLQSLLDRIVSGQVERIVVMYKDRLVRLGFELIEQICKYCNTKIEIIDQTSKTEEQELVEDLIQILTIFSCCLQDEQVYQVKKFLQKVKSLESHESLVER